MENSRATVGLYRKVAKLKKELIVYALIVLESALLIYMSLQPSYNVPTVPTWGFFTNGDLEHLAAYIIYGFLLERGLKYAGMKKHRYLVAIVAASFFAAGTEMIQGFVPTRIADPVDWVIDTVGVVFGVFVKKN